MKFVVVTTDKAEADIDRLSEALLQRARTVEDLDRALEASQTLRTSIGNLCEAAPRCRKAGDGSDPFLRELVIPVARSGYLALFEIIGDVVVVAAVRQQLEGDYN